MMLWSLGEDCAVCQSLHHEVSELFDSVETRLNTTMRGGSSEYELNGIVGESIIHSTPRAVRTPSSTRRGLYPVLSSDMSVAERSIADRPTLERVHVPPSPERLEAQLRSMSLKHEEEMNGLRDIVRSLKDEVVSLKDVVTEFKEAVKKEPRTVPTEPRGPPAEPARPPIIPQQQVGVPCYGYPLRDYEFLPPHGYPPAFMALTQGYGAMAPINGRIPTTADLIRAPIQPQQHQFDEDDALHSDHRLDHTDTVGQEWVETDHGTRPVPPPIPPQGAVPAGMYSPANVGSTMPAPGYFSTTMDNTLSGQPLMTAQLTHQQMAGSRASMMAGIGVGSPQVATRFPMTMPPGGDVISPAASQVPGVSAASQMSASTPCFHPASITGGFPSTPTAFQANSTPSAGFHTTTTPSSVLPVTTSTPAGLQASSVTPVRFQTPPTSAAVSQTTASITAGVVTTTSSVGFQSAPKTVAGFQPPSSTPAADRLKSMITEAASKADKHIEVATSKPSGTLGGFVFSNMPTVVEEKTREKPSAVKAETNKPNPFASFSFSNPESVKVCTPTALATSPVSAGTKPLTPMQSPEKTPAQRTRNVSITSPGSEDHFEPNVDFKPVVQLLEKVDLVTGEENEKRLFKERAKLYRQDAGVWKERGKGEMRILNDLETGRSRIVMRRDQVLKLCANHAITKDMQLSTLKSSENAWCYFAQDFADEDVKNENLAVRFATPEIAAQFKKIFDECRDLAAKQSPPKAASPDQKESQNQSLANMFQLKAGQWECGVCLVKNDDSHTKCPACQTPRPGVKQPEAPKPAAPKFAFGAACGFSFGSPSPSVEKDKPSEGSGQAATVKGFTFGQKPTEVTTEPEVKAPTSTLAELLKPAPDQWECKVCSVRNVGTITKCPACETARPGVKQPEQAPKPSFSFGAAGGFTFGSPAPTANDKTKEAVTQEKAAPAPPKEADKPKTTSSPFAFGSPGGFSFSKPAATTSSLVSDIPKPVFKPSVVAAPKPFTFGSQNASFSLGNTPSNKPVDLSVSSSPATSKPSAATFIPTAPVTPTSPSRPPLGSGKFSFAGVSPLKSETSKTGKIPASPQSPESGFYVNKEGEDSHIVFEPVVQLPEKVELKTGEEDEEAVFQERAKLLRFVGSEWKERGVGECKLLKHKTTGKLRVLMRREKVHKLCLNHLVTDSLQLQSMPNGKNKAWTWHADDFSEGEEPCHETFAIRFMTEDAALKFKIIIDENNREVGAASATSPASASSSTAKKSGSLLETLLTAGGECDDVVFMGEDRPTQREIDTARGLHLPDTFYNYLRRPDCPGCIGCVEPPFDFSTIGQSAVYAHLSQADHKSVKDKKVDKTKPETLTPAEPVFGNKAGAVDFASVATSGGGYAFGKKAEAAGDFKWAGAGATVFGAQSGQQGADEEGDDSHYEPDVNFAPVVQLPEVTDLKTGEEDEEVMFKNRAILFRFDSGCWKERGRGDLKILRNSDTGRCRLLLRRDQVYKVACNHVLSPDMSLQKMASSDTSWCWFAVDYADNEPKNEQFAVKLKTKDLALEFKQRFDECKMGAGDGREMVSAGSSQSFDNVTTVKAASVTDVVPESVTKVTPTKSATQTDVTASKTATNTEQTQPKTAAFPAKKNLFGDFSQAAKTSTKPNVAPESTPVKPKPIRDSTPAKTDAVQDLTPAKSKTANSTPSKAAASKPLFGGAASPGIFSSASNSKDSYSGFMFKSNPQTVKPSTFSFSNLPTGPSAASPATGSFSFNLSDQTEVEEIGVTHDGQSEEDDEEDECSVVFSKRATISATPSGENKLKVLGMGELEVVLSETSAPQIYVEDDDGAVLCDHSVEPHYTAQLNKAQRSVTWEAHDEYADLTASSITTFTAKFSSVSAAEEFLTCFTDAVEMSKQPMSGDMGDVGADDYGDDDEEEEVLHTATPSISILSGSQIKDLGECHLKVTYDGDVFGLRLTAESAEGSLIMNHIVCRTHILNTSPHTPHTVQWTAKDFSTDEPVKQTFKVQFKSASDMSGFQAMFNKGLLCAKESEIDEIMY